MKGFKFKLRPLLKLRDLKLKKCMNELSFIVKKMEKINLEIKNIEREKEESFLKRDELSKAFEYQSLDLFLQKKKKESSDLKNELESLQARYEIKKQVLAKAHQELELLEELKEKELKKYKKNHNKKQESEREENIIYRLTWRKRGLL